MTTPNMQLVQRYFRLKREQLLTMSELAVTEHPGLRGSHREELQRIYLREILPRRFSVGHGMVYGLHNTSKEADIVIWDADNYPSLPLANTSLFFAESVRAVIESKSEWTNPRFKDVLDKCRSVIEVISVGGISLEDQIAIIRQELTALRAGQEQAAGLLIGRPPIGTAAVFIRGGQRAMTDLSRVPDDLFNEADVSWPDLILWLEPGRIAIKKYPEGENDGRIEIYDCGEDSLFVFTNGLLKLLADRSVTIQDSIYMDLYLGPINETPPTSSRSFPLLRPRPGRRVISRAELFPDPGTPGSVTST